MVKPTPSPEEPGPSPSPERPPPPTSLSSSPSPDARQMGQALDQAELGLVWVDGQGRIQHANSCFRRWTVSSSLTDCCDGLGAERLQALLQSAPGQNHSLCLRSAAGGLLKLEAQVSRVPGQPLVALLLRPMDERDGRAAIDQLQRQVLEAVALGRPLQVVMDLLCRCVEALAPEVHCTVLAVDPQGLVHPLAAPSLPASFSAALEGAPIGPKAGSCGTAAWRREPVEVTDIATDPLWEAYRPLAQAYGLAACWSTPILTAPDRVGATFALYYREPRSAAAFHRQMVQACAQLCQVALMHDQHQREIERLAYYDGITGLPNRSLLADRARQMLLLAARTEGPAALLLLDVDRFKTVNDSMGHAVGDQVLRQLTQRLLGVLRDSDSLARLGGDEFVALLPGCTAQDAMHVADKLRAALQQPLALEGRSVRLQLSASVGVCAYPDDGRDLDQLLKNADIAMYEAKRAGRNCARYFLRAMNEALDERLAVEAALRQALSAQLLQLHYQPKLRLADQRLVGVEALLRWQDPQRGWIAPDRFIPVAEESGLINALDAWVLEQACAQLAQWRAQGLEVPSVAVNVSPLRFHQDDVAAHARAQLQRHGLAPQDLTLEITERLMLEDDGRTRDQLQQLHEMGVRLSVDDFGTGYSALGYLKRWPVSEIKLDRSFVRDLELDADDLALASAVIGIGRALSLSVVAEGVETEGQRHLLAQAGCAQAQGWLFSRALPPAALAGWISARGAATTAA